MEIRFGFVAMSMFLENASPSKAVTLKNYCALVEKDPEAALNKVRRATRENLANTLRILRYNRASGVALYRFSSKIIPLATHALLGHWNYLEDLKEELAAIGNYVIENGMRVSFHPDHFTLINSPREEVLRASLADLDHHHLILEAMGLDSRAKLVTHIGGGYRNKEKALEQFQTNWTRVEKRIEERLTIENDDKIFTASEVLSLCQKLSLPMVLDLHHYQCNNAGEKLEDLLPLIFATWEGTGLPPKIHVSSPKSPEDFRSHHDYVNPADVYPLLMLARGHTDRLDVMVEAKQKDRAMFKLIEDLATLPELEQAGEATLNFL